MRRVDATAPPFTNLWLLWLGAGLNAVLASFDFPVWVAMLSMAVCWGVWIAREAGSSLFVYSVVIGLVDIFFREVEHPGDWRIPRHGPVVFACAPHANQLFDGIVVSKCTDAAAGRRIGFLCAASTLRRKFVGALARAYGCIPVERAGDLKRACAGKVVVREANPLKVLGRNTAFKSEFSPGDTLTLSTKAYAHVKSVESDTELTLAERLQQPKLPRPSRPPSFHNEPVYEDFVGGDEEEFAFSVIPHVDQGHMFEEVFERLRLGEAVGVFPEGGSHDQTRLLKMKAGVSVMALGAMAKFPSLDVKVMPVGLNYEYGHRFRSKVLVDFGEPLSVPPALVERYQRGGEEAKAACNEFLETIKNALKNLTVEVDDFQTLRMLKLMAKVHSGGKTMGTHDRYVVTRQLAEGHERNKTDPRVRALMDSLADYDRQLKNYGIRDHQVRQKLCYGKSEIAFLLVFRMLLGLAYLLFMLPGLLLSFPVLGTSSLLAYHKAKEATRKSSVKVAGRDVMATWKGLVGLVLVPVLHITYTVLANAWFGEKISTLYFFFAPFVCVVGVKSTENGLRIWRSLPVLVLALTQPSHSPRLVAQRDALRAEIKDVVREMGWLKVSKAE